MVDGAALEKRCPEKGDRGFESHPLRFSDLWANLGTDHRFLVLLFALQLAQLDEVPKN